MNATKHTAVLVKDRLPGFRGHAALYRVTPPMASNPWNEGEESRAFEFVIASSANVMYSGPETYLFGADEDGEVLDWLELPGSMRGDWSHHEAFAEAGYEVVQSGEVTQ